jgi:hypothetical protein
MSTNIKDMLNAGLRKAHILYKDENNYNYGVLDEIIVDTKGKLIKSSQDENSEKKVNIKDLEKKKKEDAIKEKEDNKILCNFKCLMKNVDENQTTSMNFITNLVINKETVNINYKSLNNLQKENVHNSFTIACLKLGFINEFELEKYDDEMIKKVMDTIENYNKRKELEKIKFKCYTVNNKNNIKVIDIHSIKKLD